MKSLAFALPMMSAMMLAGCTSTGGESAADSAGSGSAASASTQLLAADGSDRGTAEVVETAEGLRVTIKAKGLPSGTHAAHIHTTGACTPPDFASAGGHWNPTAKQHGRDNPQGMHMGDMPNMLLGTDGVGELQFTIPGAKLTSGATPLLDTDGAAVVIHAGADDMKSDPAGNAGGRVACGVLKLS